LPISMLLLPVVTFDFRFMLFYLLKIVRSTERLCGVCQEEIK